MFCITVAIAIMFIVIFYLVDLRMIDFNISNISVYVDTSWSTFSIFCEILELMHSKVWS